MELVIYKPTETDFLQEIEFNHEEIKKELAVRLEKYNGLVYAESNIKDAKADRANLNKFKEAIENRRKEIKKACLKPYEDFESKIKEIVAMIDKPIIAIDTQVKNYEQIKKDEKKTAIQQFYNDKVADLVALVPFEKIFNEKWLNVTYKEADIHKEITDLFIKVESDLAVITELQTEYEAQIKDTYLKNYDLTAALQEKKRLEEQAAKLAEYKRQQEEKAKPQQEEAKTVVINGSDADDDAWNNMKPGDRVVFGGNPETAPIAPPKMFEVDFRVTGSREQLEGLKQYMIVHGIKYAPAPKDERKAV